MKFSIPFLAHQLDQLPVFGIFGNECVEAVVFNREDLESRNWKKVWKGVKKAAQTYLPENVTFHFPVNHSDYVSDFFVRERVRESLSRGADLGIHGVIVHSNRVYPIGDWVNKKLEEERQRVVDVLCEIRETSPDSIWLALENMPVMDNYGIEIDPLFVYPQDFKKLISTQVKVVFDICHFSNTQSNIEKVLTGSHDRCYYPNISRVHPFDFLSIIDQIVHWHFSAFLGVANPQTKETCKEGIIPSKSTLGEAYYKEVYKKILEVSSSFTHMVFEIQENNYKKRKEVLEMIRWAQSIG